MKFTYLLAALAAPILAAAAPGGTPTTSTVTVTVTTTATATPLSQCRADAVQCCQSTMTTGVDGILNLILGLLNVVVEGVGVSVGISCSPVTVVGASGTSCNVQPVCCENDTFNGLIAIGCVPININL